MFVTPPLIKGLRTNDKILLKIAYFILDICDSDDSNSSINFVVRKVGIDYRNIALLPHSHIQLEAGKPEIAVTPCLKNHFATTRLP